MSIEWSNFKAHGKRCADALKTLTVVAAIAFSAALPQSASAQQLNITVGSPTGASAGLPPTNLDSFVYQAGGAAANIYGDESTGLPPLFGFTTASRINTGIVGQDAAGLTTGHGSYMPCAWGADEFLAPPGEWCYSGTSSGGNSTNGAAALNAADLTEAAIGFGTNLFTGSATGALTGITGGALTGTASLGGGAVGGVGGGAVGGVGVSVGSGGVTVGGGVSVPGATAGASTSFGF